MLRSRQLILSIICAVVLPLTASPATGDETYWQHDSAAMGDWFIDANWTAGVPGIDDKAFIRNGGTAEIAYGEAMARQISVGAAAGHYPPYLPGPACRGALVQTGGTATVGGIYMSGSLDAPGTYSLIGGRLSAGSVVVGQGRGSGDFVQTGGISGIGALQVGDLAIYYYSHRPRLDSSIGTYELAGGRLTTGRTSVGVRGRGQFVQDGGVHAVEETLTIGAQPLLWYPWNPVPVPFYTPPSPVGPVTNNVVVPYPLPSSEGRYELNGGRLTAQQQKICGWGELEQTGGANRTRYLCVKKGGLYRYLGGSLVIADGLDLDGDFDFGGRSRTLVGRSALLNFSRGSLLNAGKASIHAGRESLTIFSSDFDPETELKHFHTGGLVHFAGSDLLIPAGQGFRGWGTIDDHVDSHGYIIAADGGRIDLRRGLFVHEGKVDLGDGQLSVMNDRSGIASGELAARSMSVGTQILGEVLPDGTLIPYPPGLFQQTGGTNAPAGLVIRRGRYELNDGLFSAHDVFVGTSLFLLIGTTPSEPMIAQFIQTGGTCNVSGTLSLGCYPPPYIILPAGKHVAELSATGNMGHQDGADPTLVSAASAAATYELTCGQLSVGNLSIRPGHRLGEFIQTGGTVHVGNELSVYGSNASYTISCGSLTAPFLRIGSEYSGSSGTFAILGSEALIAVSQSLSFGCGSTFDAVPGSTVHITGPTESQVRVGGAGRLYSTFEILGTDAAALAGLGNLALIFEGGDEFVATLEVAGEDRGPGLAGFLENFAIDTLQIGGDDVAHVRLVDLIDNQPAWEGSEALYVKNLIITDCSCLDLNGLNLYYLNGGDARQFFSGDADLDGCVTDSDMSLLLSNFGDTGKMWCEGDFNGDGTVTDADLSIPLSNWWAGASGPASAVPEPTALTLFALGALAILKRRPTCFPFQRYRKSGEKST